MGNRRGKITTILTIGILVVIGITTVISLLMLNKQRSTSARASRWEPPIGGKRDSNREKIAEKQTATSKGGKDSGLGVRIDSVITCSGGSCKLVANDKKNNKKDDNEDTDSQETVRCNPVKVACSNACGQPNQCISDRCGGQTCCPATAACCFSVKMDCSNTCGQPTKCKSDGCGGQSCCSATAACAPTPTPPTYCKSDQSCPINQECYQPPMPRCREVTGAACIQRMPAAYCQPIQCPKQSRGDANCDQVVDPKDYDGVFKPKMIGLPYPCDKCTADFNRDKIVNLLDYEIWRNSVLH